jgi:hypothetical protein
MITLDYLQCSTSPQHADKWAHLRPTHFDFLFLSSLFPAFALIKLFLLLLLKNSNHDNGINEVYVLEEFCVQQLVARAARQLFGTCFGHIYIYIYLDASFRGRRHASLACCARRHARSRSPPPTQVPLPQKERLTSVTKVLTFSRCQ